MEISKLLPTPRAHDNGQNVHFPERGLSLGAKIRTYSLAVSPVNPSPKLDEEKERKMTAISGQKCLGLFGNLGRDGSLVRMLRDLLLGAEAWYSDKCLLTWKVKGTKFSHLLYQLSPSMRHIDEIGSGLLPTVRTTEAEGGTIKNPEMSESGSWSRKNKNGIRHGIKVKDVIENLLPTASSRDWKGKREGKRRGFGADINDVVENNGIRTGLKLQPTFALWMMGFPGDWCDLEDGEMPRSKLQGMRLSRKSRKSS